MSYPITYTPVTWQRRLAKSETLGELELRRILDELGLRFASQVPIPLAELESGTVADFLIPNLRLILYVDGSQHRRRKRREWDDMVDQALAERGYHVLRVSDQTVRRDGRFVKQALQLIASLQEKRRKCRPVQDVKD